MIDFSRQISLRRNQRKIPKEQNFIVRYLTFFLHLMRDLYRNRNLLLELTKRDLKSRYVGSYLGILWAFIQPTITILLFWFVFQVGFKSMPVEGFPFILWLVCGMFPWFFFSDAWSGATNAIIANSFLVKKVVFRVSLLPIVQICSALVVSMFFHVALFLMFAVYGYPPSIYNVQVVYYLFALICLVFGLSLITSSLVIFLKDIGQFVGMLLQFLFWGTPIFWSLSMIPAEYQWFIKLNPLYYIIEGYRRSFITHEWFWDLGWTTPGYWLVTIIVVIAGAAIFRRLRPHFADVL